MRKALQGLAASGHPFRVSLSATAQARSPSAAANASRSPQKTKIGRLAIINSKLLTAEDWRAMVPMRELGELLSPEQVLEAAAEFGLTVPGVPLEFLRAFGDPCATPLGDIQVGPHRILKTNARAIRDAQEFGGKLFPSKDLLIIGDRIGLEAIVISIEQADPDVFILDMLDDEEGLIMAGSFSEYALALIRERPWSRD